MPKYLSFLSENPAVMQVQIALLAFAVVAVFLLCFTTRDIILRTRSFLLQAFSILLVAVLPVIGFFLYLLIRPARTIRQRETDAAVARILAFTEESEVVVEEVDVEETEDAEEAEELMEDTEETKESDDAEEQS
jgi:hypothetical protein